MHTFSVSGSRKAPTPGMRASFWWRTGLQTDVHRTRARRKDRAGGQREKERPVTHILLQAHFRSTWLPRASWKGVQKSHAKERKPRAAAGLASNCTELHPGRSGKWWAAHLPGGTREITGRVATTKPARWTKEPTLYDACSSSSYFDSLQECFYWKIFPFHVCTR